MSSECTSAHLIAQLLLLKTILVYFYFSTLLVTDSFLRKYLTGVFKCGYHCYSKTICCQWLVPIAKSNISKLIKYSSKNGEIFSIDIAMGDNFVKSSIKAFSDSNVSILIG